MPVRGSALGHTVTVRRAEAIYHRRLGTRRETRVFLGNVRFVAVSGRGQPRSFLALPPPTGRAASDTGKKPAEPRETTSETAKESAGTSAGHLLTSAGGPS